MMACSTNQELRVEEERRASGVFSDATTEADRRLRLLAALAAAPLCRLKSLYADRIADANEGATLELGAEFCRRGIAPCFRGIAHDWFFAGHPDVDRLLAICDIQWVAARHPKHEPGWKRLAGIHDPALFLKTADYIIWGGQRTPGQIAKALDLSLDQQRECQWIQRLDVVRWREALARRAPAMRTRITNTVRRNDRRDEAEQDATIARRNDLWLCAEMANWRPQRTADLYAMKTGIVLGRNLVAKQVAKIRDSIRSDKKTSSICPPDGT
jgi:hypothetical protein